MGFGFRRLWIFGAACFLRVFEFRVRVLIFGSRFWALVLSFCIEGEGLHSQGSGLEKVQEVACKVLYVQSRCFMFQGHRGLTIDPGIITQGLPVCMLILGVKG